MTVSKKATHVVIHPKLYLSVGNKLQHISKGTEITLSEEKGKQLEAKGRVAIIGQQKAVDLTNDKVDKTTVTVDKIKGSN